MNTFIRSPFLRVAIMLRRLQPARKTNSLFLLTLLAAMSGQVFAEHKDVAPIADEVIERVVRQRISRPDPLLAHLQRQVRETEKLLDQAEGQIATKNGQLPTGLSMQLAGKVNEIESLRRAFGERLSSGKDMLVSRREAHPDASREKTEAEFNRRFGTLKRELASLSKDSGRDAASLRRLRGAVDALRLSDKAPNAIGLTPIPTIRTDPPLPSRTLLRSSQQPQYLAQKVPEAPHLYAYNGNALLAALPSPTPTEAESCNYNDLDLAATLDAPINAEILALAEQLDYSPAKIYQYVYEQIAFEPYYGSLKGAMGTLYSKAGGPTDQASLLISLLRASKIPARYVRGNVGVLDWSTQADGGRIGRWLGAKSYAAAKSILQMGRFPVVLDATSNGQVLGVVLSQVWVEACVPYGHYRGVRVDNSGHRWIPLDPSFKEKTYQAGIGGVEANVSFDYTSFLAARTQQLPHEKFEDQVDTYIKGVGPRYGDNTLEDVSYKGTTQRRRVDILPSSLPYDVAEFTQWGDGNTSAEAATLPDRHRYKLAVTANGTVLANGGLAMPSIALSRLTMSFKGATGADQANLDAWRNDGNSASTLPCGINVVPILKVEGVDQTPVTTPGSVGLCTEANQLQLDLTMAELANGVTPGDPLNNGRVNYIAYSNIKAASYHALQAFAFQTADRLLTERAARLLQSVRDTANPNANLEETEGEFLHLVGLKYQRYLHDTFRRIGELHGATGTSGLHMGLTASRMKVSYLFDLPFAVTQEGFLIDFPGAVVRSVDRSTGKGLYKDFLLSGYAGSHFESYIWQENTKADAVSTVRGLQYAREKSIEVLVLTSANWASQSGKFTTNADSTLNYTAGQVAAIKSGYIDLGYTVTIPRSHIRYTNGGADQWKGYVYVAEKNDLANATNPSATATFAINESAGGFSLSDAFLYPWNPSLLTGFLFEIAPSGSAFDPPDAPPPFISSAHNWALSPYDAWGGDPVNLVTGNVYHVERDLRIKGRGGLDLVFERSYNSREAKDGPLGFGWTHSFNQVLDFVDDNANGTTDAPDSDGLTSSVRWTDGGGSQKYVRVTGAAGGVAIGATFTAPAGFNFQTTRNTDGTYSIREKNGFTYTFESSAGTLGQKARLIRIADRNGNKLTVTYAGTNLDKVTDDLNRALTFTYTGSLITEVRDWSGRRYQYGYDAGNLVSFKNPLAVAGSQNPVTYAYYTATDGPNIDHALKQLTLPRGNGISFEYYANGRAFRQITTAGEAMVFTYNDFRRETVVTNPSGNERRYFFDKYGNPTRILEENGAEREYAYDPANPYHRVTATDPMGRSTGNTYDGAGNVTRITLPSAQTIDYANFNSFNQPGKIKDPRGNYTLLKYDAAGNLLQEIRLKSGFGAAVDPASYSPVAAQIAAWTINTYDSRGNLTSSKRVRDFATQTGPTTEFTYNDAVNNVQGLNATSITRRGDKDGNGSIDAPDVAPLAYDNLGRVTQGLRDDWYSVTYQYDAVDRVVRATDGVGKLRDYRFDANGNPIEQLLMDSAGTPAGKVDGTSAAYDQSDRRERSLDAGGNLTRYGYDAGGNLSSVINPDNTTLAFDYDAANRIVAAYDQEGHRATTERDVDGRVRGVTDPNGNTALYSYYDASRNGRLKRIEQPKVGAFATGRATEYDYDGNGNVVTVTEYPADYPASAVRRSFKSYDELNRLIRVAGPAYTDADYGNIRPVTQYVYNGLGYLTQILAGRTDATGTNAAADVVSAQTTYVVDDFGRRLRETDPLAHSWNWTYDLYGNVLSQSDGKGQITSFTWDYGHQMLTRSSHNGQAGNLTYTRNALGLVIGIVNTQPAMSTTYTYDSSRRLKTVTDSRGNKTLTHDWSPGGLLNSTRDSEGNEINYRYDAVGRLKAVYPPNGEAIVFGWDAGGRLTQKWFPNGISAFYSWNADGTLAALTNKVESGTPVSQQNYTYDGFGRRSLNQETVYQDVPASGYTAQHTWRYTYDALDRLTEAYRKLGSGAESLYTAHRYDVYGNLKRDTYVDNSYYAYTHDAAHQLKTFEAFDAAGVSYGAAYAGSFAYDNNGSLVAKNNGNGSTRSYSYDVLGRMVGSSASGNPATETYTYDHAGRRINKTVAGASGYALNYLYNGADLHAGYLAGWTSASSVYTHGPGDDDILMIQAAGQPARYQHSDGLGSVVMQAEASSGGNYVIHALQRYDPWGNITDAPAGSTSAFAFTGREQDDTGLMYYRARYYSPSFSRFIQKDPLGLAAGINPYAYVGNSPTNYRDPSGMLAAPAFKVFNPNAQAANKDYTVGEDISGGLAAELQSLGLVNGGQQVAFCIPCAASATALDAGSGGVIGAVGYRNSQGAGAGGMSSTWDPSLDKALGSGTSTPEQGLLDKMATEIGGIVQRNLGPEGEVYSLRATRSGDFPNVRGGSTFLNAGDVYKYGETTQPDSRYSNTDLQRMGLRYEEEYRGSQAMAKIVEKLRIYGHVLENGELPPGNRIFR